jgi:hypothetical protein
MPLPDLGKRISRHSEGNSQGEKNERPVTASLLNAISKRSLASAKSPEDYSAEGCQLSDERITPFSANHCSIVIFLRHHKRPSDLLSICEINELSGRLRHSVDIAQRLLAHTRPMSRCNKNFDQFSVFRGFEASAWPPGLEMGGRQFDHENGLSQNWIFVANRGTRGRKQARRTVWQG